MPLSHTALKQKQWCVRTSTFTLCRWCEHAREAIKSKQNKNLDRPKVKATYHPKKTTYKTAKIKTQIQSLTSHADRCLKHTSHFLFQPRNFKNISHNVTTERKGVKQTMDSVAKYSQQLHVSMFTLSNTHTGTHVTVPEHNPYLNIAWYFFFFK